MSKDVLVIDGQTVVCTDCATRYGHQAQQEFTVWFDTCQVCRGFDMPCVRAEAFGYLPNLPTQVKMRLLIEEAKGIGEDG